MMEMACSSEWVIVLTVIALGIYLLGIRRHDYFKKRDLPFVKPKPFVGNLGAFFFRQKSFAEVLVDLYDQFKGHRVAGYFEFMNPVTLILDPEIIRLITVKDFDHFVDHKFPVREDADPLIGRNLFSLQGERWRDMRHTLSPAFTSSKMKAMFLLVRQIGEQLRDHLDKRCAATKDGLLTIEIKDIFTRYANDVIATSAFGLHVDSLEEPENDFYKLGKEVTNFDGRVGVIATGYHISARLMKMLNLTIVSKDNANIFRSLIHDTIKTRERENIVRPDMIHLLMQAKKGTLKHDVTDDVPEGKAGDENKKKAELTDDDVTAQALVFLLAGFDTVSTLLCFTSYLLALHPDAQRRAQVEIDHTLQENRGQLTYDAMQRMSYMDMVISESLRLFPPAAFNERRCTKAYTIAATVTSPAVHLEKGDGILIPSFAMHRDPEFFPDPLKFDPERFSEENKPNMTPFVYSPFGLGPRSCIGNRFALMEAKIALTCLLSRFDLEAVSKTVIPIGLGRTHVNLVPKGGSWLGIRPREASSS